MIGARSALVFTRGKPPGPARVAGGCGTSRKWKTKEEALGKCGTVKLLVGVSSGEVNLLNSSPADMYLYGNNIFPEPRGQG
ncbi:hypothetical protein RUM44_006587 [Polyplax serrata]|uniref:Uncharacterized protein n=1 Tax=Polyplax serrata TaxID=468196 RepID=A0ABR1AII6_POLSC